MLRAYINLSNTHIAVADDTNIFSKDTNYETVINYLNDDFRNVTIWLKSNKLCLNARLS